VCPAVENYRIWMSFAMVGRLAPRMWQVDGGGDRPMGRAILGVDMGRSIVITNEDFVT